MKRLVTCLVLLSMAADSLREYFIATVTAGTLISSTSCTYWKYYNKMQLAYTHLWHIVFSKVMKADCQWLVAYCSVIIDLWKAN